MSYTKTGDPFKNKKNVFGRSSASRSFDELELKWDEPDFEVASRLPSTSHEVKRPRFGGNVIDARIVERKTSTRLAAPTISSVRSKPDFVEADRESNVWRGMSESDDRILIKVQSGIKLQRKYQALSDDGRLSPAERKQFKELSSKMARLNYPLKERVRVLRKSSPTESKPVEPKVVVKPKLDLHAEQKFKILEKEVSLWLAAPINNLDDVKRKREYGIKLQADLDDLYRSSSTESKYDIVLMRIDVAGELKSLEEKKVS